MAQHHGAQKGSNQAPNPQILTQSSSVASHRHPVLSACIHVALVGGSSGETGASSYAIATLQQLPVRCKHKLTAPGGKPQPQSRLFYVPHNGQSRPPKIQPSRGKPDLHGSNSSAPRGEPDFRHGSTPATDASALPLQIAQFANICLHAERIASTNHSSSAFSFRFRDSRALSPFDHA